MKNKKLSVTIGIPAYNEEKVIVSIVSQTLIQKEVNFKLDKIIVSCDACTDNTVSLLKKNFGKNKKVLIIDNKKRSGKPGMINILFRKSQSDVLVCLDADIRLGDNKVISNLVSKFEDSVGLVGGNIFPTRGSSFVGKLAYERNIFWKAMTENINQGDSINNNVGRVFALSKNAYKRITVAKGISADDDFVFLSVRRLKMEFKYAKQAIVYYRVPNTVKDFMKQLSRFKNSENRIVDYFGKDAESEYTFPVVSKVLFSLKYLFQHPISFLFVILSQMFLIIGSASQAKEGIGSLWEPVKREE